jgi:hypothetical protein
MGNGAFVRCIGGQMLKIQENWVVLYNRAKLVKKECSPSHQKINIRFIGNIFVAET